MRSYINNVDNRRQVYLSLVSDVESQIRDAYAERHEQGIETQTSLAEKLGVNRSVVNRRLRGLNNLTLESLADLVWGLGQCIKVEIFDPSTNPTNHVRVESEHSYAASLQQTRTGQITFQGRPPTHLTSTNGRTLNVDHNA